MLRLPDRIHLVRMSRPMTFTRYVLAGSTDFELRSSVVDLDTLIDACDPNWPSQEIDVTDHEWEALTWLGWSLVLAWKQGTND